MKKIMTTTFLIIITCFLVISQVQEQLSPTEKKNRSVVTEPLTIYKGFLRAGLTGYTSVIDKIFMKDGKKQSLDGNIWGNYFGTSVFAQYGFSDRFQAEISINYRSDNIYQSVRYEVPLFDTAWVSKWKSKSKGFGDTDISIAYQLIPGSDTKPFLGLFIMTTLPTGEKNLTNINPDNPQEHDRPTGNGEYAVLSQLKYRKINYPFSYTFFAGYKMYSGGKKVIDPFNPIEQTIKTGNYINVAANFSLHLNDWIVFKNFIDFTTRGKDKIEGQLGDKSWNLLYYPGLSFQLKRFRLDQTIIFPIMGKLSGADISYSLIGMYVF